MPRSRRHGFSMVEMLVVVAIIAVLIGLLFSGVQVVRKSALQTQCSNNLANLGFSYRNWKGANDKAFPVVSWVSELSRNVENAQRTFLCPMDDGSMGASSSSSSSTTTPASGTMSGNVNNISGSSMVPGATMYIALFMNNHTTPVTVPDYGGSNVIAIQQNGLRSRQAQVGGNLTDPGPGGWWAQFETTYGTNDSAQALDWDDLFLLVQPQPNGTIKVTFSGADNFEQTNNRVGGDGGESFDLLDGNQNIVAANMQIGQSAYIPMVTRTASGGVNASSYGMNSRADYLTFEPTKILLLEYKNTIARVVAPANADIQFYGTNVAARHNGILNVLFADGHIETKSASDIDPNNATYQASFWAP